MCCVQPEQEQRTRSLTFPGMPTAVTDACSILPGKACEDMEK